MAHGFSASSRSKIGDPARCWQSCSHTSSPGAVLAVERVSFGKKCIHVPGMWASIQTLQSVFVCCCWQKGCAAREPVGRRFFCPFSHFRQRPLYAAAHCTCTYEPSPGVWLACALSLSLHYGLPVLTSLLSEPQPSGQYWWGNSFILVSCWCCYIRFVSLYCHFSIIHRFSLDRRDSLWYHEKQVVVSLWACC